MLGFLLGTVLGQVAGAAAYMQAKTRFGFRELPAAIAAGLATTIVASVAFLVLRVHEWFGSDPEASRGISVFVGVCLGIMQGVLFRGRPLARREPQGHIPRLLAVWTCSNCGLVSGEGTGTCSRCGHERNAA